MATSMITHLLVSFSCTIMSGLLHGMCLFVMIGESHRMVHSLLPFQACVSNSAQLQLYICQDAAGQLLSCVC